MADAVTSQTIIDTDKRAVIKLTNISDGTGESSVKKVDVSALNARSADSAACSRVTIDQVWYDVGGLRAALEFDATSNVVGLVLGGSAAAGNVSGHWDYRSFGGIKTDKSNNTNESDVNFVVPGAADSGNMYTVVAEFRKLYS